MIYETELIALDQYVSDFGSETNGMNYELGALSQYVSDFGSETELLSGNLDTDGEGLHMVNGGTTSQPLGHSILQLGMTLNSGSSIPSFLFIAEFENTNYFTALTD